MDLSRKVTFVTLPDLKSISVWIRILNFPFTVAVKNILNLYVITLTWQLKFFSIWPICILLSMKSLL